jgi:hypothetical protein
LFEGVSQGTPINTNLNYTKFMWSVGGGLDIELSRHISIRAGQIDYEVSGSCGWAQQWFQSDGFEQWTPVLCRSRITVLTFPREKNETVMPVLIRHFAQNPDFD